MRTLLAVFLLLMMSYTAIAKKMVVRGVVTDSMGVTLKDARVVIYTNKCKLLALGFTDIEGRFSLSPNIKKIDNVVMETELGTYISTRATLSPNRMGKIAVNGYSLIQNADTIVTRLQLLKEKVEEKRDDELVIFCLKRIHEYAVPKMHGGIWGRRSYVLDNQKSAYAKRLKH